MAILADGGRALDAVIAACVVMEDDPDYNAGTGAHLKLDGNVSMDAAVQDSTGLFLPGFMALPAVSILSHKSWKTRIKPGLCLKWLSMII